MVRFATLATLLCAVLSACGDERELSVEAEVPRFEPGNTGPFGGHDPRAFGPPSAAQEMMLILLGLPQGSSPDPVPARGSSPDPVPARDLLCPAGNCSGAGRN